MAKRTGKTSGRGSGGGGGGKSKGKFEGMSLVELQAELNRRQRATTTLLKRRERLLKELQAVDVEIAKHGASSGSDGRRLRARNAMSLIEAIRAVLDGKTMGVNEVADAVQQAGYISTSPAFRTIVNQTLINNQTKFKRVSRGRYTNR